MKPANRLSYKQPCGHPVIAFLVFGGKKLPEPGAGLGKSFASFRNGLKELDKPEKKVIS